MYVSGFFSSLAEVAPAYRERSAGLSDKIILGSDFPYQYADQIAGPAGLGLGDEWMRSVLWRNGARLHGVEGAG